MTLMSSESKDSTAEEREPGSEQLSEELAAEESARQEPEFVASDEIQQWREFARKYARQVLTSLLIVTAAAAAINFYRNRARTNAEEATTELFKARTVSERQSWLERYPKSEAAPVGRLRLASALFGSASYGKARDAYEAFLKAYPNHPLAPMAQLGACQSMEAAGSTDAALKGFEAFMTAHPKHFLLAEAVLGKARCLQLQGRLEDARATCEDYIAKHAEGEWTARVEEWLKRINRTIRRGPAAAATPPGLVYSSTTPGVTNGAVSIAPLVIPPVAAPASNAAPAAAGATNAAGNRTVPQNRP
jgi:TolA-binding protein